MFKIKGNGVVWDVNAEKPLIRFKNGEAETADVEVAERLKELGFEVSGTPETGNKTNKVKGK